MLHLQLPNGLKMPALGLGTWQATDTELEQALENAFDIGYRHFDTAILYENEHIIGKVINEWISSGRITREELFITTKLPPAGMYPEKVNDYLTKSLQNLQLDYVDLYLIHSPDGIKDYNKAGIKNITMDTNVDHTLVWRKMEEQVIAGLTKSIGLSNFSKRQIENVLKVAEIKPANVQIELHVYSQQQELVDFCKSHGITVVAYSPLGSPGMNAFYSEYGVRKELPNLLGNPVVKRLAIKYDKTEAQILLRHTLQKGLGAIPKSTSKTRQKENISLFDFCLSDDDMMLLNGLDVGLKVGNWESWTWV